MSKKKEKKKNNKLKIIIPAIIIPIILVILVVFIVYTKVQENKSLGADWADLYYDYVKEKSEEYQKIKDKDAYSPQSVLQYAKDNTITGTYIKESGYESPIMLLEYDTDESYIGGKWEKNNESHNIIILFERNNKIECPGSTLGENFNDKESNEKIYGVRKIYLYDKETKESNWYLIRESKDSDSVYLIKLADHLKEAMYTLDGGDYNDEEYKELRNKEMNLRKSFFEENDFGVSEFNKKYIDLTDTVSTDGFEFKLEDSIKDIKKEMTSETTKYIENEKTLEKEIDKEIKKEEKTLENNIKKQADAEEAERIKKEEEAKKQAEEEARKGITINGHTIKYGKYVGKDEVSNGWSIVLNSDKTFNAVEYNGKTVTGTFKIEKRNYSQSEEPDYREALAFYESNGSFYRTLTAWSNTTIGDNDIFVLEYAG